MWNVERDGSVSIRSRNGDIETSIGLQDQDRATCILKRYAQVWVGYTSGCIRVFTASTPSLVTELLEHRESVLALAAASSPYAWIFSGGMTILLYPKKQYIRLTWLFLFSRTLTQHVLFS